MSGPETRRPKLEEEVGGAELDIHKILEEIHREEKDSPRLEMSDRATEQLKEFLEQCKSGDPKVVAVIRCWNKNREELAVLFSRLEKMRQIIPELGGAIVAINADQDKDQQTSAGIEEILAKDKLSFSVVPLPVRGYTWTAGLNGPAALLHQTSQAEHVPEENIFVFNLSFDVEFNDAELEKIAKRFRAGKVIVTARQEGEEDITQERRKEVARIITDVISHPEKKEEEYSGSQEILEKILSVARNTAALASLSEIVRMGGYNNFCNKAGGQEDQDLYTRILLEAFLEAKIFEKIDDLPIEEKEKRVAARKKAKKILEALRDAVGYQDPAWNKMPADKREAKIKRETTSRRIISKNIFALVKISDPNKYKTPEQNRDFNF
jgi:hypothetical protein